MSSNVRVLRPQEQTRFARVGDWFVDLASNRLLRGERELRPTPKAMAVLRQLMLANGAPQTRTELLDTVWRDAFPTDDVLTHAITELRRAIEEDPKLPRHIETIPKVGYRLLTSVEWLEHLPGATVEPSVEAAAAASFAPEDPPKRPHGLWIVAAVIVVTCALLSVFGRAPPPSRVDLRNPLFAQSGFPLRPVTAESDSETFPSISPDGTSVAYTARYPGDESPHIYLRGLSGSPPIRLSRSEASEETYPVWSPDGTQIAFVRMRGDECRIVVVAALGGREREASSCEPHFIDYFDWTRDGRSLLISRLRQLPDVDGKPRAEAVKSLHLLALEDGRVTPLDYQRDVGQPDIQPRASPDGTRIAFRRGAVPYSDIFVVGASGGAARQLTRLRARIRGYDWLPDNRHILLSSDHGGTQSLYLLDTESGDLANLGIAGGSYPAVSRSRGLAVFQQDNADVNLQSFRFDAAVDAAGEGIASSTRSESWPAFAPNDDRLAFVSNRGGDSQLWLSEPGARTSYQITHHDNVELSAPNWSPDGRRVLYVARGNGQSRLYSVEVDSGQTRLESAEGDNVRHGSYSWDGHSIFYVSDRDGAWHMWQRDLIKRSSRRLSDSSAYSVSDGAGNGKLYFANMSEGGLYSIDLASGSEERVNSNVQFWNMNAWRVDPTGLYYLYSGEDMKPQLFVQPWDGSPPRLLRKVEWALAEGGLALDRAATRAVLPVVARDDTDVMLLDLSAVVGPDAGP
ncbi:winged helix-turn-helix domain-containing protein [Tahibacter sp.]|uniref:winged helix-turn-helix domain-containing protein n=1 Tax=Tahibacter sp. TaxID=2056211 RepID=UPI0028C42357|nr:winged helix-turn-helix domain-containing protein [Tahibacter sp.]